MTQRLALAALFAAVALAAAGCRAPREPPPAAATGDFPPFASRPYEPFSREAAVQVAYREWRAFGSPVVFPHSELPYDREREVGLWQRVGEYWWLGLPPGWRERGWTGIHDEYGRVFPASEDGNYAWSAAFIDYVMRMAGAGTRFPYAPAHADYINAARRNGMGLDRGIVVTAERPESYMPRRGDLICMWRGGRPVRYDDLPAASFPGHCDIVVAVRPGLLDVIGGNVDNAVSMKHIPVAADGRLAAANGAIIDPDYPWFVVLRVDYQG